jgi:hypothetical protein
MNIYFIRRFLFPLERRRIFLFLLAFPVLFVLCYPFKVYTSLPGEVRYSREDRLIARENGYVVRSPGEGSRLYRAGEAIFILDDPFLRFARERVEYMLNFDRLLFEQQRSLKETLGDSLLTGRKIESDLHAAKELERKISDGRKVADRDVIFIPLKENISGGYFVRSGFVLGKLCSGDKIVRVYADDQQIKSLKAGAPVKIWVKDQLFSVSGTVKEVYYIPVFLQDSPALQNYGGEIPVDVTAEKSENIRSLYPVYAVDIIPEQKLFWQSGRFVRADIARRRVLAAELYSLIISAFRRGF